MWETNKDYTPKFVNLMLYNEGKKMDRNRDFAGEKYAATGIGTHDLPTQSFFGIATPS